jgi:CMP-N-acetylneuraminic acid synthetase/quercetin dioxygenase-like cupin family protein
MTKTVAMIPARLGSQRVPQKNLRLLGGKPLIAYIIEAAKQADVFDEIYINSEADIFGDLALEYGVRFYKRPAALASNEANNDSFLLDFIQNVKADVHCQLLPTSPLITPVEIRDFLAAMKDGQYECMVSVVNHQIAALFNGKPVNFSLCDPHRSSQTMTPVQTYATVLMAWTAESFLRNTRNHGGAYHGGDGKIGYFPLKGLSTIDIDHEEDFTLAEVALEFVRSGKQYKKEYWAPAANKDRSEVEVPAILKRDGVEVMDFSQENQLVVNLREIIRRRDNSQSWCQRVVNTENNSATLISQLPGEGNRRHYHPDWNEWWYIVSGEWKWEIDDKEIIVREGDLILIPKQRRHRITAVGQKPAVRLAVSKDGVPHVYPAE